MTRHKFTELYEDKPCKKCGDARKYVSTGRCVSCSLAKDRLRYQKRKTANQKASETIYGTRVDI